MKNKSRKFIVGALVFFLFVGLAMILIPLMQAKQQETKLTQAAESWEQEYGAVSSPTFADPANSEQTDPELLYPELRKAMEDYNREIYETGQAGLVDAWSYQAEVFDLSRYGVEGDAVGVIEIPKIEVKLPLYLGGSYANMAKGFAQLSQTSMPIGGEGTNCVVACHRGYQGAAYLRDADQLSEGALVFLTNFWDSLCYKVSSIKVIEPSETENILIQPNRDLLTLVTCTPYRVGSHRLLIICERVS